MVSPKGLGKKYFAIYLRSIEEDKLLGGVVVCWQVLRLVLDDFNFSVDGSIVDALFFPFIEIPRQ